MEITVRFPATDEILMFEVGCDDLTKTLKDKIVEERGLVSTKCITLLFEGCELHDEKTVLSYGIVHDSELTADFSKVGMAETKLKNLGIEPTVRSFICRIKNKKTFSTVPALIFAIPDLNVCDDLKYPITESVKRGAFWITKLLVDEGVEVNMPPNRVLQPLYSAALQSRYVKLTKLLLDAGADPNGLSVGYLTPLMAGCSAKYNLKTVELLIQSGATADAVSSDGQTALMKAIRCSEDNAKYLIENVQNLKVNNINTVGQSALSLAIAGKLNELVRSLLEIGADPNIDTIAKHKPLVEAIRARNLETIKLLLDSGAELICNKSNAICTACEYHCTDALELILNRLKEQSIPLDNYINSRDPETQFTPLMQAAKSVYRIGENETSRSLFILLLQNGADPNAVMHVRGYEGSTALHIICSNHSNDESIIEVLLEHGAVFDIKNAQDRTPLEASAMRYSASKVLAKLTTDKRELSSCLQVNEGRDSVFSSLLMELGADPNFLPYRGRGIRRRRPFTVNSARSSTLFAQALDCGGDINATGEDGVTPLMVACSSGCVTNVKILLEKGAHRNLMDQSGRTAANYASKRAIAELMNVEYREGRCYYTL